MDLSKCSSRRIDKDNQLIDEVAASRVHIVEAETSDFLKRDEQSSASVTVKLHPGQQLSKSQVAGISALVAGAVKKLKASQVVLVDETGALLSGDGEEDESLVEPQLCCKPANNMNSDLKSRFWII